MTLPFALPFISARPLGTAEAGVLEMTLNAYLFVYHPHTDAQKHIERWHRSHARCRMRVTPANIFKLKLDTGFLRESTSRRGKINTNNRRPS